MAVTFLEDLRTGDQDRSGKGNSPQHVPEPRERNAFCFPNIGASYWASRDHPTQFTLTSHSPQPPTLTRPRGAPVHPVSTQLTELGKRRSLHLGTVQGSPRRVHTPPPGAQAPAESGACGRSGDEEGGAGPALCGLSGPGVQNREPQSGATWRCSGSQHRNPKRGPPPATHLALGARRWGGEAGRGQGASWGADTSWAGE